MTLELLPAHHDLTFMSPLSEVRAAHLVQFLAGDQPAEVLDLGCGWGELLLRVLEAAPGARGRGIDLDEESIEHGRSLAAARGLAQRASLEIADAQTIAGPFDAVICAGASQIWGAPVEDAEPLNYLAALVALRDLVRRGGRLVYAEGIWSNEPTEAAIKPLAGRLDEFVDLAELCELAANSGFAIVAAHEASLDEWDEFESGYTASYAHWLAAHPAGHPDAQQVRDLAAKQRTAYFGGYRGILGFAYLELIAV